ncbi:MAG: hypothetical protein ACI9CA_000034 [Natronomonas sp.]|jgi:hypothetical protein
MSEKPHRVSEAERVAAYEEYDRITARSDAARAAKTFAARLAITPVALVLVALLGGLGTTTTTAYVMLNIVAGVAMGAWTVRAGIRAANHGGAYLLGRVRAALRVVRKRP